ncbi:MAG: hypothetical protein ABSD58_02505 [Verrucomicrobiia bacterium]|jgi:hypothetical protein
MIWGTLFHPIRIGLSIFLGMMAAAFITINYWNDRPGDDPATIQQATAMLEQFREHTASNSISHIATGMKIESLSGQPAAVVTNSSGKAVSDDPGGNWLITLLDGRKYVVKASQAPTAEGFAPYIQRVAMDGPWNDMDQTIDRLTKKNGVILRAKAMTCLDRKPASESSLVWDDRFVLATSDYDVCTTRTHIWETVAVGCGALLLSTVIAWCIVAFLPLLGCFLGALRSAGQRLR